MNVFTATNLYAALLSDAGLENAYTYVSCSFPARWPEASQI